ncbi:NAD(P)-binding protein [Tilletiaria anomala UBC 951]|uniref:NAD(P)-binding protein n=1 Tax=Tilletiaria anomala (strain ATCC 24038 / CBS 436.72 / UBC 951) TaxID=1037660 RepID=A0A066VR92_TILAU|nr:NAD(P)-binding protein [Tilletiaria anomala UBC 951]KDN44262.1 NAD(P)-binding protein [Tilletiaria anomala UBC 951]
MSPSNGIQTVALAGVGNIGSPLAFEFLENGLTLSILTRDTSKADLKQYAEKGANLVQVDYSSEAQLTQALRGIDVVVSTLPSGSDDQEKNLAKAAKQAGVKLFVKSEWGLDYDAPNMEPVNPMIASKMQLRVELKEVGPPIFVVSNGLFATLAFSSFLGSLDAATRKAVINGNSAQKFSLTAFEDVARFTRLAITRLPIPPAGSSRVLRVQGFAASFDDLIATAEQVGGNKFEVAHKSYESVADKQLEPSLEGLIAWLLASLSDGRGLLPQDKLTHDEVGFKPSVDIRKTVETVLKA